MLVMRAAAEPSLSFDVKLKVKLWVQDSLELPVNSTFLIYAPRFAPDVNECGTTCSKHAVKMSLTCSGM